MTTPAFQADIPLIIAVTINCNDFDRMAQFWPEVTGEVHR